MKYLVFCLFSTFVDQNTSLFVCWYRSLLL